MRRILKVTVRTGLIGFFAVALAGCAWTSHDLDLKPTANVVTSTVGQNTRIFYRFSDERDDTTVGNRSVGMIGAKVTAQNLPGIIDQQLRDGLKAKGYQLIDTEANADA